MSGDAIRYSTASPVPVTADNPLTLLIHRLEAATSRLEDIATSSSSYEGQAPQDGVASAGGSVSKSPQDAASKAGSREGSTATVVKESLPPQIEAMDSLINSEVKAFLEAGKGLDEVVEEQVRLAWQQIRGSADGWYHRQLLSQKPSPTSDDSSSQRQKRRSPTRSPRLSWIC